MLCSDRGVRKRGQEPFQEHAKGLTCVGRMIPGVSNSEYRPASIEIRTTPSVVPGKCDVVSEALAC
jgi:hypothetical protein